MNFIKKNIALILVVALVLSISINTSQVLAANVEEGQAVTEGQEQGQSSEISSKALSSALAIGLASAAAAIGMGIAIGKATEGISRQPEAEGKIRTALMLGLVFIETVVIYALIVAILVIFVL